jgi:hypothetical protein
MRYLLSAIGSALLLCPLALAQTGPALLLKPNLSETEMVENRGDALFLQQGTTSNNGAPYQMQYYEVTGRFREQRENFIPRVGWELTYIDQHSSDQTLAALDKGLTDVSIAAGLEVGQYSDWTAGLTVGVGYAGDTPFGESDAWYAKATLIAGRKLDTDTDLAFVVDYDGNRSIWPDLPLPGLELRKQYDPYISYTIGVPVIAINWKPNDVLTLDVIWTMIDSFDARLEYKLSPHWRAYGALEDRHEAFHVEGLEGHDRLLFHQRRAELGIEWKPWEHTKLKLAGGYAWGGEFSAGWEEQDSDEIADLSDEPYVRIGFERRF